MKKIIKQNYKFIICFIVLLLMLTIQFPYYIDAPGGISDVSKKIEINGCESKGSFNIVYVKEYKATLPTMFISLINKDWDIIKKSEVMLDTEDYGAYDMRDKIFMQEAISNAIYVAYTKANKSINIKSNRLVISYIANISNTNLKVGDEIIEINNKSINNKDDITNIVENLNIGDKLVIKVKSNEKTLEKYAYIVNDNGSKKLGLLINSINEYETVPTVEVKVDDNESGSSGGLVTALAIYNSLVEEDITKGLKIVGTGTIDMLGNVGSISGVEYKLKSAVKNKADLFIVPNEDNYEEAIKLKEKNNYKINIIGVSTFDEVIEYLKNVK